MNELRDGKEIVSPIGGSSFVPLITSQKANVISPMEFTKSSTTDAIFFDENNLMQNTANYPNNMPPIPPRSAQSSSALPRPGVNQRSSKGLLPPPISTTSHRQSTETKSDPFADDFFT